MCAYCRLSRLLAALAIAVLGVTTLSVPVSAISYDRNAARQYADQYWSTPNSAYVYFGDNDCTNYVSQALRAGGVPFIGTTYNGALVNPDSWFYFSNAIPHSWSVAMENYPNMPTGGLVGHAYRYLGNRFDRNLYISTLTTGDFVMFDDSPPTNGLATHGRFGVGWMQYWGPPNYDGGYRYLMNQHSPSRYHVPWDYNWNPNTQNAWKISVHG